MGLELLTKNTRLFMKKSIVSGKMLISWCIGIIGEMCFFLHEIEGRIREIIDFVAWQKSRIHHKLTAVKTFVVVGAQPGSC